MSFFVEAPIPNLAYSKECKHHEKGEVHRELNPVGELLFSPRRISREAKKQRSG